jgi:hypothetical protein
MSSTEPQPVSHDQAASMTGDRDHHGNTTPTLAAHPESDNLSHKPPEASEQNRAVGTGPADRLRDRRFSSPRPRDP